MSSCTQDKLDRDLHINRRVSLSIMLVPRASRLYIVPTRPVLLYDSALLTDLRRTARPRWFAVFQGLMRVSAYPGPIHGTHSIPDLPQYET
jgi:hypothetical protein